MHFIVFTFFFTVTLCSCCYKNIISNKVGIESFSENNFEKISVHNENQNNNMHPSQNIIKNLSTFQMNNRLIYPSTDSFRHYIIYFLPSKSVIKNLQLF